MKKSCSQIISIIGLLVFLTIRTFAQAPEGFTYQAVTRDGGGKLLANKSLTVKTSILPGLGVTSIWEKDYNVSTDIYGMFTLVVGDMSPGTLIRGYFSGIDWGSGTYFLNVKVLYKSVWLDMGTTQLLSVPYALYAKSAGSAKITETDPVFGLSPANGITSSLIDNWNSAYGWGDHEGLYRPVSWVPAWAEVAGKPFRFDSPKNGDLLMYDQGIERWINQTPNYLTSYTETDPFWTTASVNYYTKTNMQTSGQSQLHFNNLTNKPTTLAGYGITDAGLSNFTESNCTYDSKTGVKLLATNAATDVDLVISPIGYGSILAQQSDGTNAGGNNRGVMSVDLQMSRNDPSQVARGNFSAVIGGERNTTTASASYSFIGGGYTNTANGLTAAIVGGLSNTANGNYSFVGAGLGNTAASFCESVFGLFETNYTPASTTQPHSTDRLFVVGNGTPNARSNAITILKNANTTIGGSLTINGNGTSYSFPTVRGTNGQVLKTNADGTTSWAAGDSPETDPVVKEVNGLVISNGTTISAAIAGTDYLVPGQAVTTVSGTGPIVSSGGTTPAISINPATTSAPGSMSAADKIKLDGIAAGAEVNVQPDWNQATTTADDFIKNKPTIPAAADGSETKVSAGTNVTVTGTGTTASPYVVNITGSAHAIGESYGGGIVFFVYDNGQHGLIAATADQNTGIRWYNGTDRSTGTTGDGLNAGAMNTAMINASQTADSYYGNFAAKVCTDYSVTVGGIPYGDWYLPSKDELNLLYLQKDVIGGFSSANYWSSSEYNSAGACYQYFATGGQSEDYKYLTYYVRAIRAF